MSQRINCTKSRTDTIQKHNESKQNKTASTRELNDFPIDTNYQIKNELVEYEEDAQEMDEININDFFWGSGDNSYEEDNILESSNNMEINDDNPSNNLSKIYEVENRCAVCKKKFSFQRDLVKHVKENHPIDKAFKCRHCPTLFSKLKSVSTHLKRCHADLANTFSCDYCSKSFFRKSLLERHRLVHSEYIERSEYKEHSEKSNHQPHNEEIEDNNSSDLSEDIFERRKGKIYPIEEKCGICKKKFSPQRNLVKHIQEMHPNDKAYKCLYCPTSFSKLKSVTTHYKRGHSKMPKKVVCEVCGMYFYTNFLLERHRRVHMEVRPFGCNKCDKTYKYKRNLLVHIKTHERDNNKNTQNTNNMSQYNNADESCEYDEDYYENEEQNDDNESEESDNGNQLVDNEYYGNDGLHLFKGDEYYENDDEEVLPNDDYVSNEDQYKLTGNEEESILSTNGQEHYNNSSPQNPFKCNICGNVYKYKKSLKYHQKKHHTNVEQRDTIIIDDTTSNNINNLNINTNSTYFIIDEFNTDTENFDENLDELENDDIAPDTSAYTNEYTYEGYMPESSEISTDINQYECGVCSKTFNCQQSVAKHLQRCHPEIEFFKCPYCDDNFYSRQSLSEHIKAAKHVQKRNVCEICLKSFNRNSDLRRHKRVHTNERPYVCNICLKTFKQDSHLKRHKDLSHRWIKPVSLHASN